MVCTIIFPRRLKLQLFPAVLTTVVNLIFAGALGVDDVHVFWGERLFIMAAAITGTGKMTILI